MPASLTDLVATKTSAEFLRQILAALQGIGHTQRLVGSGLGAIYGSGVPSGALSLRVLIATSGGLGAGTFQVSLNGGLSYGSAVTIPSSGLYVVAGTGVSLSFDVSNAASVENPYVSGDTYAIELTVTTVPVSAWQPGSLPLTLLQTDADVDADFSQLVQAVAKGGFVTLATKDWLDLVALNVYALTRTLATTTQGVVTFTAASGVGPYSLLAGDRTVATASGLQFVTTSGGTLTGGGTLQVTVEAASPGAAYNVGNATITQLLTPLAGVTVNNPDPGGGSWVTSYGTDTESDSSLVQRCKDRWPSMGVGATKEAYDAWARAASSSITRTNPYPDASTPGQVDVVVAGPSGPVAGGVVTLAQNYINARLPLGITAVVVSASAHVVTVAATVYVQAAYLVLAQQQCPANVETLIAETDLGGAVYPSELITALSSPTGVTRVVLTSPAGDEVLTASEVATLSGPTLTFVAV
jgi:uncharacterized phage protein gp47/JayE